jgi:RNA polymerase sigma-70 factor (ECF subfamily)
VAGGHIGRSWRVYLMTAVAEAAVTEGGLGPVTEQEQDWLARRFEDDRRRLRAVAYRMLGSVSEAEDAVQEAWLRLSTSNPDEIENLSGWLTTVVARVSLNLLRSRAVRREEPLPPRLPDPIIDRMDSVDPEHEALIADSVGLALLVVLETLTPAERLAFVLHDMFGVPFEQIAGLIDRSPQAARQLASRARRRVRAQPTTPDASVSAQQEVVNAFLAAAHEGDFDALVALLDPDVVLRADGGSALAAASAEVHGALAVARQASMWSRVDLTMHPALVNGAFGMVTTRNGAVFSIASIIVRNGKIAEMDFLADPDRLAHLDLTILDTPS